MNRRRDVLREGLILSLLIAISLPFFGYAFVYEAQTQSVAQMILNTENFYDPTSDVSVYWKVNGAGSHWGAVDDGVRNNSTPILVDYIYSSKQKADIIGFPDINKVEVSTIILWVYSATGSNAKTIINLRNDNITQASLIVNPNSPQGWRSTTWQNPSSIGTITVEFIHAKEGTGAPTESIVYAVYIEVRYTV